MRSLCHIHIEGQFLCAPINSDLDLLAGLVPGDLVEQVADAAYRVTVDPDHDIAGSNAGHVCRAVQENPDDELKGDASTAVPQVEIKRLKS